MANSYVTGDSATNGFNSPEEIQFKHQQIENSGSILHHDVKSFINVNAGHQQHPEVESFLGDFQTPLLHFNNGQKFTNLTNFELSTEDRRYCLQRENYGNFASLQPLPSIATISESHHGLLGSFSTNGFNHQDPSPPLASYAPNYALYEESDPNLYLMSNTLNNGLNITNMFQSQTDQHHHHQHHQLLQSSQSETGNVYVGTNNITGGYMPSSSGLLLPPLEGLYSAKKVEPDSLNFNSIQPSFSSLYENTNPRIRNQLHSVGSENVEGQYSSANSVHCHSVSGDGDPNDCGEKLNTREVALQIGSELKRYSIPQSVFAQQVLCRSQGTLSDLLRNPKPWSKLKSGRETFRRMWKWLQEPEYQRLATLRMIGKMSSSGKRKDYSTSNGGQKVNNNVTTNNNNNNNNNMLLPVVAAIPSSSSSSSSATNAAKKPRLVFTDVQRRTLMAIFEQTRRPNKEIQTAIADQLGLKISTVANFFMNARRRSFEKYVEDEHNNESNASMPSAANMEDDSYSNRTPSSTLTHV